MLEYLFVVTRFGLSSGVSLQFRRISLTESPFQRVSLYVEHTTGLHAGFLGPATVKQRACVPSQGNADLGKAMKCVQGFFVSFTTTRRESRQELSLVTDIVVVAPWRERWFGTYPALLQLPIFHPQSAAAVLRYP